MNNDNQYDNLLEIVKNRRSVRFFKSEPFPDEFIDKIIEVARWAPSGFHTQPWEYVVVKQKELRDKIVEAVNRPKNGDISCAPVFILILCDSRTKAGLPPAIKARQPQMESIVCSSLANACLYTTLAASTLGLVSCWVTASSFPEAQIKIKELLHIPEALTIYDMLVVGYGENPPVPKTVVRTPDEIIHWDDSGKFRTDEEVQAYIEQTRDWCISAHKK
jgi:nitroreductase